MNRQRSKTDVVPTPEYIWKYVRDNFSSKLFDPCPLVDYDPLVHKDGLLLDWCAHPYVYVNPPFSKMRFWIDKAFNSVKQNPNMTIVLLCKTDVLNRKYFFDHIKLWKKVDILLFNHRIKFEPYQHASPFGVCLLVFSLSSNGKWKFIKS